MILNRSIIPSPILTHCHIYINSSPLQTNESITDANTKYLHLSYHASKLWTRFKESFFIFGLSLLVFATKNQTINICPQPRPGERPQWIDSIELIRFCGQEKEKTQIEETYVTIRKLI